MSEKVEKLSVHMLQDDFNLIVSKLDEIDDRVSRVLGELSYRNGLRLGLRAGFTYGALLGALLTLFAALVINLA